MSFSFPLKTSNIKCCRIGFNPFHYYVALFIMFSSFQAYSQETTNQNWLEKMQDSRYSFQEVQQAFETYWGRRTDYKGNGYKVYKRWEYINEFRILPDGKRQGPNYVFDTYKRYVEEHPASMMRSVSGSWSLLAPTSYPINNTSQPTGVGRINAIAFDATDSSHNTIFIGSPSGGFWKTIDHGTTWNDLSADIPTLGVSSIVVHPTNPNIIYLGTGDRDANDAPPMGVFKSTDGGTSWVQMNNGMGNVTVGALLMHPTNDNILLAATSSGIYKTTDGGNTWTLKAAGNFKDIKFKPGDPSIVYAVKIITPSEFYRSSDTGDNWTKITSGIPTTGIGSRMVIGVSAANANYVYLVQIKNEVSPNKNQFATLLRSTDSGLNFTSQSTSLTAPNIFGYECDGSGTASQATYDLCISVNPDDVNHIFVGSINNWQSTDGGVSWDIITHWSNDCSGSAVELHADQHVYEWHDGKLYVGHDGGLSYSANDGSSWTEISSNLAISQLYKIGQSVSSNTTTLMGLQDNGSNALVGGVLTTTRGGDGTECIIDYSNNLYCYNTYVLGDINRSQTGPTGTYNNIAKTGGNGIGADESGAWVTPYTLHRALSDVMFAGYENVWRTTNVKASPNTSVAWSAISTGETTTCRVLEQSPADVNVLYVVRSGSIKRTDNANASAGSVTWTNCSLPGGSTPSDIKAHHTDANIVYATAGYKVYKSIDKGMNWSDISVNLPGLFINCLVLDKNDDEGIYIGNQTGVWYKNADLTDWTIFNNGLPIVDIRELEIYYDNVHPENNRLKAATYGRGLWESDLIEVHVVNPSNFTATAISSTQIDLSWVQNNNQDDVLIAVSSNSTFGTPLEGTSYNSGDILSGGGTVLYVGNLTAFQHTLLSPNTTYYYKIWSKNDVDTYSAGLLPISATTDCEAIAILPFNEDFIDTSCWRIKDHTGEGNWEFGNTSNVNYATINLSPPFAYFESEYGVAHQYESDLISPTFDFSSYFNVVLQFKHLFDSSLYYPSNGRVYYSIDNGSNWIEIASYSSTDSANPALVTISLNAVGGYSQVKFKWTYTCSPTGAYLWAVDDISIFDSKIDWVGTIDTDWFKGGNWGTGVIPTTLNNVKIPVSATNQPHIDAVGAVCANITIDAGASLTMNASTAYTLSVSGDWNNNGTFTAGIGTVDFNGNNILQTVKGSSTTNFYNLKVTKLVQSNILEVLSLITLSGASNPLVISSGTFKLSSASTLTPYTSSVTITSNSGFWNNGGIINAGAFGWLIDGGLLRISEGTINIGTNSGSGITYINGGTIIIDGGQLNVAARISPNSGTSTGSFTQSGGIVTVMTVGSTSTSRAPFEINSGVPFTMIGGTIVIQRASSNAYDYLNSATTSIINGGTLQIGASSTPASQTIKINSTVPIYNLLVNANNSPTAQLLVSGLTVKNDLTISGGTLNSNGLALSVGGNWSNDGLHISGTGTVTFNGVIPQSISGSTVNTFHNLTIDGVDVTVNSTAPADQVHVVNNMLVNIGKKLTIPTDKSIKIDYQITNNGSVVIENKGSLVQLDETDSNTGTGVFNIKKKTGAYYGYDYIYWSSPLNGESVGSVFPTTGVDAFPNYRYTFNPQNYLDVKKGPGYPQTNTDDADGYDDNADDWSPMNNETVMPKGLGFIVMGKGSSFPFNASHIDDYFSNGYDVSFDGTTLNNGTFTTQVRKDLFPGFNTNNNNLNLLGNPYPSAIDIFELYHDNESIMEGKFYFWTHNKKISNTLNGPNAYDFSNSSFAIATITGSYNSYTLTQVLDGSNVTATRYIPSCQGFMASMRDEIADPSILTYQNSQRISGNNSAFLRISEPTTESTRLWLNLTNGQELFRQIAIGFDESTSDQFGMGDAPRIDSADDTDFYSMIVGDNGHYAIQFLGAFEVEKQVPLGVEIAESGTYVIALDNKEGIFTQGQKIYLEDTEEGIFHDFGDGAYTFNQTIGTNINNRFILRFTNSLLGNEETVFENLRLYPNPTKGLLNIAYSGSEPLQITLYDQTGKLVGTYKGVLVLDLSQMVHGIYFAKISNSQGSVTRKIILE